MAKERKASVIYEGNGAQQTFSFPFDYLRKAFVKAEIVEGSGITELEQGKDYSITDKELTLASGVSVATGKLLKIYRETTTDPLVEWQDASVLRSADLSLQEVQLLHLAEETADKVFDSGMSTAPTNTNVWDGQYKRLTDLLDPQEDGDAVTLRYINDKQHGLITALKNEGATQDEKVKATGDTYVATMTNLKDTATTQASNASQSASNASTQATNAGKSASNASASATTASTKATEASNSATLSKAWAMSDSSPDGVSGNKSSKTWANEAKTSASNAATSASTATSKATEATTQATNAANSASAAAKSAEDAKLFDPATYYSKTEVDNKISTAHNYIKRNTAYKVGDILESPNLPHGYLIVVTQAGTTGSSEPDWITIKNSLGGVVSDGTVQFVPYKIVVEKDISKIFMEKNFQFTIKSVESSSGFRIMNEYDIHVNGYKPLAFVEIYFSGFCSLMDHYWNSQEKATVWAFNNGPVKDITINIWILYVKDTFR